LRGYLDVCKHISERGVYNPAAGSFSGTTGTWPPRVTGTWPLHSYGLVLIAGGQANNLGDTLASAELSTRSQERLRHYRDMTTARYQHTATMLPADSALCLGGFDGMNEARQPGALQAGTEAFAATPKHACARYLPRRPCCHGRCSSRGYPRQHSGALTTGGGHFCIHGKLTRRVISHGTCCQRRSARGGHNSGNTRSFTTRRAHFCITGNMTTARYQHTATLLPHGSANPGGNKHRGAYDRRRNFYIHGNMTTARFSTRRLLPTEGACWGYHQRPHREL